MTIAQLVALGKAEKKPARAKADEGTLGDLQMFSSMKLGG